MKNVIITGANGMIGSLILQKCLNRDDVKQVTILTRKKIDINQPKLREIIHSDFSDFSNADEFLKDQDICFYCIGVYTGQVKKEEFYRITVDFTKAFAEALRASSNQTVFCFLSGQGADSKEKSRIMFARDKGIAENILLKLKFKHTHIFRPGYIYPVSPRTEPNAMYKMMRVLYKIFHKVFPDMGVASEKLADTMVKVGFGEMDKVYFENREIRLFK